MSHTTTLKTITIKDVSAMRSAVLDLVAGGIRCQLLENAQPRMYYAKQHGKCDFVLNLQDGQYDVGFDKQTDGSYAPVFDEWGGHIAGQIGASCPAPNTPEGQAQHRIGKFMQAYSRHAAVNAAIAQGYMVEGSSIDDKGNVHLVMSGM